MTTTPDAPSPGEAVAPPPRGWPVIPTILVLAAVATMIALGIWQLQRKGEKEALIALFLSIVLIMAYIWIRFGNL